MSSHAFLELIASVTNIHVNPHDFALASLAQLSVMRSAAVSISVIHSSNFAKSCSLKMAMSCSRELVRCVCFFFGAQCVCVLVYHFPKWLCEC